MLDAALPPHPLFLKGKTKITLGDATSLDITSQKGNH